MIIHPAFSKSCCCCCGERAKRGGQAGAEFFVEVPVVPGPVIEGASRLALTPEEQAAGRAAAESAAARARVLPRPSAPAPPSPVWVESYCGADRDCVPDSRFVDSYETAKNGAAAWNSRDPSRYVILREKPGAYPFEQFGPSGPARSAAPSTVTRGGAAVAVEQQRRKLSGAFGG